jgi:hypothetical protein
MVNRLVSILLGRKMYAMGNALAIGLRKGLIDAGVPVHYQAELTDLVIEEGRVVGVRVVQGGTEHVVRARRGVGSDMHAAAAAGRECHAGALLQRQTRVVEVVIGAGIDHDTGVRAAAARLCERNAKSSCACLEIRQSRASVSAVCPMLQPQTGSESPSCRLTRGAKSAGRNLSIPRIFCRGVRAFASSP